MMPFGYAVILERFPNAARYTFWSSQTQSVAAVNRWPTLSLSVTANAINDTTYPHRYKSCAIAWRHLGSRVASERHGEKVDSNLGTWRQYARNASPYRCCTFGFLEGDQAVHKNQFQRDEQHESQQ